MKKKKRKGRRRVPGVVTQVSWLAAAGYMLQLQSDCHQTVPIYDPFKSQPFVGKAATNTAYKQHPQHNRLSPTI
jgi:hypothetical protein